MIEDDRKDRVISISTFDVRKDVKGADRSQGISEAEIMPGYCDIIRVTREYQIYLR